jgi:hypothetical protein
LVARRREDGVRCERQKENTLLWFEMTNLDFKMVGMVQSASKEGGYRWNSREEMNGRRGS